MPNGACIKKDCTVASTGICLDLIKPVTECPNFIPAADVSVVDTDIVETSESTSPEPAHELTPALKSQPTIGRRFHAGTELGIYDAAELMRGHYSHLIGVLGQTDAGKTAFLSALYLMASRGWLKPDYIFAGGLTLQGFEDRVRRVREWENGQLADKFMLHTQLGDARSPSFMNLAIKELRAKKRRIELLLTDLPGEWTSSLVRRIETATRFSFFKRADGIIYAIDGPLLAEASSRHVEVHNAKLLLARLLHSPIVTSDTPLVLLLTKSDELNMVAPPATTQIVDEATKLGFKPKLILSSSFSRKPAIIESGTGVIEAISYIINHETVPRIRKDDLRSIPSTNRMFGRFHAD